MLSPSRTYERAFRGDACMSRLRSIRLIGRFSSLEEMPEYLREMKIDRKITIGMIEEYMLEKLSREYGESISGVIRIATRKLYCEHYPDEKICED